MADDQRVTISVVLKDLLSQPAKSIRTALSEVGKQIRGSFTRDINILNRVPGLINGIVGTIFNLRTALVALGTTGALALFVRELRQIGEEADRLSKMSRVIGLTTEMLDKLRFSAGQSGLDFEQMATGLRSFTKSVVEYERTGTGRGAKGFSLLGISPADLRDANGNLKDTVTLLTEIADQVTAMPEQERLATLVFLFGNAGEAFAGFFEKGSEGIRELIAEAERLGGVISTEQGVIGEELGDAFDRLFFAIRGIRNELLEAFGPYLTNLLNRAATAVAGFRKRIDDIAELIQFITKDPGQVAREIAELGQEPGSTEQLVALRKRIQDLFVDLSGFLIQGATRLGVEIGAAILEGLVQVLIASVPALLNVLKRVFASTLGVAIIDTVAGTLASIQEFFGRNFKAIAQTINPTLMFIPGSGRVLDSAGGVLQSLAHDTREGAAEIRNQLGLGGDDPLGTSRSLVQEFNKDIRRSLGEVADATTGAIQQAFGTTQEEIQRLQEIGGPIFDAIRIVADEIRNLYGEQNEELEEQPQKISRIKLAWNDFKAGAKEGAQAAVSALSTFQGLGQQIGATIGGAVLDFGAAISDALTSVRSLGEGFREVATQMLRQIGTLIIQFLLLRAIATAVPGASGFFGVAAASGWAGGPAWGLPIRHFAGGGKVFGPPPPPSRSADNIPAMLRRGEWVVNEDAVRYYGDDILYRLNNMLIPRAALAGWAGRTATAGLGGGLAWGGPAASASGAANGPSGVAVAVVAPTEASMERLATGGRSALLSFIQDNAPEINAILGDRSA